jgi:hypothetical protein
MLLHDEQWAQNVFCLSANWKSRPTPPPTREPRTRECGAWKKQAVPVGGICHGAAKFPGHNCRDLRKPPSCMDPAEHGKKRPVRVNESDPSDSQGFARARATRISGNMPFEARGDGALDWPLVVRMLARRAGNETQRTAGRQGQIHHQGRDGATAGGDTADDDRKMLRGERAAMEWKLCWMSEFPEQSV